MTDTTPEDINERHRQRMERKKAVIDAEIAAADKKVGVVQFIKGAMPTGEEQFLRRFPDDVSFHAMGEGYTWETQDRERDIAKAEEAWRQAKRFLADPAYGLVVLDELNIALKYRYLGVHAVSADLLDRPAMQHVVITGRAAQAGTEW